MHVEYSLYPRRIGLILGLLALYLAVQSIVAEYIIETQFHNQSDSLPALLLDTLSVNAEQTIPTWYSVALLLLAATLLLVIGLVKRASRDGYRFHWLGLAIIFLYLSIDEGATIHEMFGDPLQQTFGTSGFLAFGWQLLAAPLVIILAVLYLRFLLHLPSAIRYRLIAAGMLYVGGALAGDAVGARQWELSGGVTLPYLAIGTVEELMEMLGVVTLIYTLLRYMVEMQYMFTFHPTPTLKTTPPDVSAPVHPATSASANRVFRELWQAHPLALVVIFLAGTNLVLLTWALSQRPPSITTADQPLPFYSALNDQIKANQVTVVQMPGALAPDNQAARQTIAALLAQFETVLVVTLPLSQTSIAFAGHELPFDRDRLAELLRAQGEAQFVIFDTAAARLIVAAP
jgi:hypothetical protein